jgi:hypothetical protein
LARGDFAGRGIRLVYDGGNLVGIDIASVKLLLCAKNTGADFSNTLQLGRQGMHTDVRSLGQALAVSRISADAAMIAQNEYSEAFFSALGATCISSLDLSDFEGATIIHDLNQPIPVGLSQRFSVVHDGGTLEHVFNFPQALKNCMEMVRVGGYFTQVIGANNFMGHGFWQISPELIYRVFTPQNGFNVVAVLLHEVVPKGGWYLVSDPEAYQSQQIGRRSWELRVELCNNAPTYILTIARRTSVENIFAVAPQQSNYVLAWRDARGPLTPLETPHRPFAAVRRLIPSTIKTPIRKVQAALKKKPSPFDRPYYCRLSEDEVILGRFLKT